MSEIVIISFHNFTIDNSLLIIRNLHQCHPAFGSLQEELLSYSILLRRFYIYFPVLHLISSPADSWVIAVLGLAFPFLLAIADRVYFSMADT